MCPVEKKRAISIPILLFGLIALALVGILLSIKAYNAFKPEDTDLGNQPGQEEKGDSLARCSQDSECVGSSCCHSSSCVHASSAPECEEAFCTLECRIGTLDCGYAKCVCDSGKCKIEAISN